jgi:hypothetical protein
MTTKASARWRVERSIAASYFFRRTGRSQKGPGGLSGRSLPRSPGGSAAAWLLPLPGPVGRVRAGGALRAGPRAGLGLRAGLAADPAPGAGLGARWDGPFRDGAPNHGGAEPGGWAGGAVGGGAGLPDDRAGLPDDRAGRLGGGAGRLGGGAAAGGRGATPGQRCREVGGAAAGRAGGPLLPAPPAAGGLAGDEAGLLAGDGGGPLAGDRPVPVSAAPDRDQPEAGREPVPPRSGRSSGGAAAGLVSPSGVARARPRAARLARPEAFW